MFLIYSPSPALNVSGAMATELDLVSLVQSQQTQNRPNPSLTSGSSCMWNPNHDPQPRDADNDEEDDSWEARAFAEDTGNIMGATWPPRSYSCTFCRREFRSAQALGGHMNVHRRDRARLHQTQPATTTTAALMNPTPSVSATTMPSSTILIPTRQFPQNGGLCLLYRFLPNPNWVFNTTQPMNAFSSIDSPSTRLPISPYPSENLIAAASTAPLPLRLSTSSSSSLGYSTIPEQPATTSADNNNTNRNEGNNTSSIEVTETSIEELDLELRLGHRPTTP